MFASDSSSTQGSPVLAPEVAASAALAANIAADWRTTILHRNNVHVIGEGKPPLLLCNGFGCSQQIWRYLVPTLAKHYQLVLFDYVGSGETDIAAYNAHKYSTLAGYAQDIVEICQALALQDVVLIGHSVGAMIGMLAALAAPQHFARAIFLAATPYCCNEPGYYGGFERADVQELLALMQTNYHDWTGVFASILTGQNGAASLGEELIGYFCTLNPGIANQFAQVAFFADNRDVLTHFQLPTLLVQCAEDVISPEEVGRYLLSRLPQAQLVLLPVAGHCPHLSVPFETLAAIEAFLG